MMDRVVEQSVVWTYKGQTKQHKVRYFVAGTDVHVPRAAAVTATELGPDDLESIARYQKACEEGRAVVVEGPTRRRIE